MTVKIRKRKRKTSTSIMLDYTDAQGKRVQHVFGRASTSEALERLESEAAIEAKRIELELLKGKHLSWGEVYRDSRKRIELSLPGRLDEFLEFYWDTTAAIATKRAYLNTCNHLRQWLGRSGGIPARLFKPEAAIRFIQHRLSEGKAPGTVKGDVVRLSRIWKRLVEQGHVESNPWRHSDVVAVTPAAGMHERAFTDEELKRFLDCMQPCVMKDLYLILSQTGLRSGEALALRPCDVDLCQRKHVSVSPRPGWKPKTKRSIRQIPLADETVTVFLRVCRPLRNEKRIFPLEWTPCVVSKHFNLYLKLAGLDAQDARYGQKLRVHSLRHYYATKLVTGGVDVATIRDLLGHASIQTTNRYFNAPPEAAVKAVQSVFGGNNTESSESTDL